MDEEKNEERIITKRFSKNKATNSGGRMNNVKSATRKDITTFDQKDPREKCKEIPLKMANERRQKLIKDKRTEKKNENNAQQDVEDQASPEQLNKMIKQLTQAMNKFMETTNKELESIKEKINLNYEMRIKDNKYMKTVKEEIDQRMENLINEHKEMSHSWETIRTFVENLVEEKPDEKRELKTNNEKINKDSNQQPALKAILYDKYFANRARLVTKKNNEIKTYRVTISYKLGYKMFFVKYNNRWIRLREIIDKLRSEGLIFGFKNIIRELRTRNNNKVKTTNKIPKTVGTNQ